MLPKIKDGIICFSIQALKLDEKHFPEAIDTENESTKNLVMIDTRAPDKIHKIIPKMNLLLDFD